MGIRSTRVWLLWTATGLGAVSLVLVVINAALMLGIQTLQTDVRQRQQFINQGQQLSRLNDALVRALADAVVGAKDETLRAMLARHGITVTAPGQPQAPANGKEPAPKEGSGKESSTREKTK